MNPILEIKSISKKFRIHHEQQPYLSLRDSITSLFQNSKSKTLNSKSEDFWALKDVSFDVYPSESIGIIGKNGAGKSTLLKILSKITPPTEGRIISRGRIASLLEVGTGFHPELTGRENIFLNGSILGMKQKEIQSKFDEIIDFSGVEKFLDTPLKHYSSGMQLRLAFAVAAFLEPEILVIDEVLAVGDMVFQQKCINKMIDISKSGRSILFVSHNLAAMRSLCKKSILLENGKIIFSGNTETVIDTYSSSNKLKGKEIDLSVLHRKKKNNAFIFEKIFFENEYIKYGEPIKLKLKLFALENCIAAFHDLDIGIAINDKNGCCLIHATNRFINTFINHVDNNDTYHFEIENILRPGFYNLTLFLRSGEKINDWLSDEIQFNILDGNPYNYTNTDAISGIIFPKYTVHKSNSN